MTTTAWPKVPLDELTTLERRPIVVEPDKQYAEIGIYSFGRGIFHKTARSGFEVGNKDLYLIKARDFGSCSLRGAELQFEANSSILRSGRQRSSTLTRRISHDRLSHSVPDG